MINLEMISMKTKTDMTYSDAIEQVMLHNGYFAPLKLIYQELWKYKNKDEVRGGTPEKTIQERVQRDPRFTRIGLGVYALTKFLDQLPSATEKPKSAKQAQERLHANIQGMLLEIGNSRHEVAATYTHDKKWIFQNKPLGSLATLHEIPPFTYPRIIHDSVRFFDVIWFNPRGFPYKVFEVEQSTNFRDAFTKFMELQDFQITFYCVAAADRHEKFQKELSKSAFTPIRTRCEFRTFEQVQNDYELALRQTFL
jgi:hypothetical protein